MSKRENDAVVKILADPENSERSAEELADLVIGTLDDLRSKTHRLAVVGQIAFPEAPETVHTVVLGPFSCRGTLDTQEKFLAATEGGSAARTAGQELAWDTKKGRGRGRFMLVPAFQRARSAWDFFREPEKSKRGAMDLLEPPPAHIEEAVERWSAGLWASEVDPHPACICGIGQRRLDAAVGYTRFGIPTGWCEQHQSDTGGRNRVIDGREAR